MMKIKQLISEEKLQKMLKSYLKNYEYKEINFICTLKGTIFFNGFSKIY